ncbi:hypothetical protein [Calycomorphotria hydatis]|uniref:Uncharacterized protein n=1 Tax=Calycomorphotria hydatis TaxID=2528027 RepID=A0A517T9F5_9PLAN|nr:hypothetical protein [Calycomorphotria hydatis]QDT65003.1 hypothetical protein V22_22490 [Calycomorphotria hydatis]
MRRTLGAFALIGFGFALGLVGRDLNSPASAQVGELSRETTERLQQAARLMQTAQGSMEVRGQYVPAVSGLNAFALFSGGVNAVEDLEAGRGVDPVTFAGLYAGLATDEIQQSLSLDDRGRLTYNGRVVRMYPVRRIKQLYAEREALLRANEDIE